VNKNESLKRGILLIVALGTLLAISLAAAPRAAATSSEWENWTWRRTLTLPVGESTPAGYQENVLLAYNSGMSFENFQDSRFVWENSSGKHALPYWFERVTPGVSAYVWVRLPVALAAGQNVENLKWYYGNSSAAPAENGAAVFDFFDNFDGTDWQYEKKITISGARPENYQLRFALDKVDNLGGHCMDNFQDLRFYDANHSPLDFWRENYINGDNVVVLVNVKDNTATEMYVRYGNPSAAPADNGAAVFDFFDNFDGTTIDTGKWWETDPGSHVSQNGKIIVDAGTNSWDTGLYSNVNFSRPFIYEFKWQTTDTHGGHSGLGIKNTAQPDNIYYSNFTHFVEVINGGYFDYYHGLDGTSAERTDTGIGSYSAGTNIYWRFVVMSTGAKVYYGTNPGLGLALLKDDSAFNSSSPRKIGFVNHDQSIEFDDARVRKYVSTEPTISMGAEVPIGKWVEVDPNDSYVKYDTENKQLRGTGSELAYSVGMYSVDNFDRPMVLELDTYFTGPAYSYTYFGVKYTTDTVNYDQFCHAVCTRGAGRELHYTKPNDTSSGLQFSDSQWAHWGFIALPSTGGVFDNDLSNGWGDNYTNATDATASLKVGFTIDAAAWRIDNVRVHKFVSSPPTVTIGEAYPVSEWYTMESWSGAVSSVSTAWSKIEGWSGVTSTVPSVWSGVESWNGTLSATANWTSVESWAGTASVPDTDNPTLDSFTINAGAAQTTSSTVTLSLSASDVGFGVYQMCFRNSGGAWSDWEAYSTSKSWTLSAGDGAKTVDAMVRDYSLNESNTLSDGITKTTESSPPPSSGPSPAPSDTTPPALNVLEPTTASVGENVTVRASATDASGIDSSTISVTLDGSQTQHTWSNGVVTSALTRLGMGAHTVKVTVKDASNNHNSNSVNVSFYVFATGENAENLAPEPTEEVSVEAGVINPGENKMVTFDNENLPLKSINLVSENTGENRPAENVTLTLQVLENAPAGLENVRIYAYIEISVTVSENTLSSATIGFAVSKAWMLASDVNPLAVALYHYEGGAWVELRTVKTGEDDASVYYSSTTNSFSPFAICVRTVFTTFALQLPAEPLQIEGGYAQIVIKTNNPGSSSVTKHLELRFGGRSTSFDATSGPHENGLTTAYVSVDGMVEGIYDVELYDPETDTVLDSGSARLLESASQGTPETPVEVVPATPPLAPLAMIGAAVGVLAGLSILRFTGKLPNIRPTRTWRRAGTKPASDAGKRMPAEELGKPMPPVVKKYCEVLGPAAGELFEKNSPMVQGYIKALAPAAAEALQEKGLGHSGQAIKPYNKRKHKGGKNNG